MINFPHSKCGKGVNLNRMNNGFEGWRWWVGLEVENVSRYSRFRKSFNPTE